MPQVSGFHKQKLRDRSNANFFLGSVTKNTLLFFGQNVNQTMVLILLSKAIGENFLQHSAFYPTVIQLAGATQIDFSLKRILSL